ncbi:MAG: LiaI-LiaF-like domain-containing protein [Clostridium sp.]|uniref:LiaI-LiaF-like domain-containing protein n=1 Tax=Clostridium sp. TaxID=1506 RepID=UPI003D6CE281
MIKGRRVGTFTTGIVLVMFGIMFLLRLINPSINYLRVASLWPLVLVLLGIEIIVAYVINKEEIMKYDFKAIILIIIVSFFAMGMGCMEYVITHMAEFRCVL